MTSQTSPAFFEEKYCENPDPWNFATSEYELNRYRAIVAALGNRRFCHAVEPGCSLGILTSQLATMCDAVYAFDFSSTAAEAARARCAALPHVTIACHSISSFRPRGADLLLLSEIGYYFSAIAWKEVLNRCIDDLAPSATILACHWLGHSDDHILEGDEVHGLIHQAAGLTHEFGERHPMFRIDRWRKTGVQK